MFVRWKRAHKKEEWNKDDEDDQQTSDDGCHFFRHLPGKNSIYRPENIGQQKGQHQYGPEWPEDVAKIDDGDEKDEQKIPDPH